MGIQAAALYALVGVQGGAAAARDLTSFSGAVDKGLGKLGAFGKNAGQVGKGVKELGQGTVKIGEYALLAATAAAAAAEKVGIEFQDAFAGVRKTVEGTEPELQGLYDDLKALSDRIPVKFTDLAAIAQEAGALGVAREDVVGFTEDVARLSAATVGLTPEMAAEAFGKLGNVLHLHGPDYERAASSLIALGNAGASSEGDIVEVAKRFSAAGSEAKLSAAQVLGFSSAIASLGVEPEAAGSSLSRLFNNITKYIGTGNVKIKEFAKVSGMSVKEFSSFFAKDAAGAVEVFLQKLGKMDRFKASAALKAAGIINTRDINAVLLLSQNYGELKRQVDLSTKAYADNTALAEVSGKRFDTLKAHLTELGNAGLDAADDFSQGLSPSLDRLARKAAAFVLAHKTEFKDLGTSLGQAIDKIDWHQVELGAGQFVDVLKVALDLVEKIPVQVDLAVASFLALNKLSGGVLGAGVGDIAGGVAKMGINVVGAVGSQLLSKIPIIGGGLASIGAARVFVTNWPNGFGGPGAADGLIAGAGEGAGILGGLSAGAVGSFLALALLPVLPGLILTALQDPAKVAADDYAARRGTAAARGLNPDNVPTGLVGRGAPGGPRSYAPPTQPSGGSLLGGIAGQLATYMSDTGSERAGIAAAGREMSNAAKEWDTASERAGIRLATVAASFQGLADRMLREFFAHVGGESGVEARAKAKGLHPTKTAIHNTLEHDLLHKAEMIARSTEPVPQKILELQGIAKAGDTKTRTAINASIRTLRTSLAGGLDKIRSETASTRAQMVAALTAPKQFTGEVNMDGQLVGHVLLKYGENRII